MTDILYGTQMSLFSGKARAYMDWKAIDYREELAVPAIHQDVIIPNVGRSVIPVVQTADGEFLQDTTLIIDHYERTADGPSVYPDGPAQRLAALLLETYGDEWLVIPAMHYRWNYNEEWVLGEFGKTVLPDASAEEQLVAGKKRGASFRGFCAPLGVNPQTIPAIEQSYEALLRDMDAHFAAHDYLLGGRPSIGDYGLIGPLYAHNYRDPKSGEIMERIAPRVAAWVRRCVNVETPLSGDFAANDEIPETLLPILRRMMDEQMPYLQKTADSLSQWATAQDAGAEVSRATGMVSFAIEGVVGERVAMPFSLWMLQRALDHYHGLQGEDRAAADAFLGQIGGDILHDIALPGRLDFRDYKLFLDG